MTRFRLWGWITFALLGLAACSGGKSTLNIDGILPISKDRPTLVLFYTDE
jgi:hypothetical protein